MEWPALLALAGLLGLTSAGDTRLPPRPSSSVPSASSTPPAVSLTRVTTTAPSPTLGRCPDNICCSGTTTIHTAGELQSLSACGTFVGDVILENVALPTATNNQGALPSITIPLKAIEGSLVVDGVSNNIGAALVKISMESLTTVGGDISFKDITNLEIPQFPSLEQASSIVFEDVTFSQSTAGLKRSADDLTWDSSVNAHKLSSLQSIVFDNTNINVIGPFLPSNTAPLDIYVQNNGNLATLDLSSTAALGTVNISNNLLTTLDFADLASVTSLNITSNSGLASLSLPNLTTMNWTIIANNPKLKTVEMPELSTVDAGLYLNGSMNSVNLPSLHAVSGNIMVESSGHLNCGEIQSITADGHPAYCTHLPQPAATLPSSSVSGSSPTPFSTSSSSSTRAHSSSGLSSGATIGIGVGVGVGGAFLLALVLFFCWRSRRGKDSHSTRSVPKERSGYSGKGDYYTYREVPYETSGTSGAKQVREEPQSEEHTPSSLVGMGDAWVPAEPAAATTEGRTELEEQQGARHEMDARSIDFSDDDEEAETRSLEDIERVHQQR